MRHPKALVTAALALALQATPAWAHPSTGLHIHTDELVPFLALVAAVVLVRRWRRFHSAHTERG